MKNRHLVFTALFGLVLGLVTACDILETCGTCEMVTVEDDGTLSYSTPTIFCGDELADKETAGTVEIDGKLVYWICK
jgi:hypothetical protein